MVGEMSIRPPITEPIFCINRKQTRTKMNSIIEVALSQFGIKEIVGKEDNPEVLKYFKILGFGSLKDETAWCSAFMNWVAITSNHHHSGKLNARSWLKVGHEIYLENAQIGDVVIFWRESRNSWKGHVGIFVRQTDNYIYVIGGNQSNRVKISGYGKYRVLGVRRLHEKIDPIEDTPF